MALGAMLGGRVVAAVYGWLYVGGCFLVREVQPLAKEVIVVVMQLANEILDLTRVDLAFGVARDRLHRELDRQESLEQRPV